MSQYRKHPQTKRQEIAIFINTYSQLVRADTEDYKICICCDFFVTSFKRCIDQWLLFDSASRSSRSSSAQSPSENLNWIGANQFAVCVKEDVLHCFIPVRYQNSCYQSSGWVGSLWWRVSDGEQVGEGQKGWVKEADEAALQEKKCGLFHKSELWNNCALERNSTRSTLYWCAADGSHLVHCAFIWSEKRFKVNGPDLVGLQ